MIYWNWLLIRFLMVCFICVGLCGGLMVMVGIFIGSVLYDVSCLFILLVWFLVCGINIV